MAASFKYLGVILDRNLLLETFVSELKLFFLELRNVLPFLGFAYLLLMNAPDMDLKRKDTVYLCASHFIICCGNCVHF